MEAGAIGILAFRTTSFPAGLRHFAAWREMDFRFALSLQLRERHRCQAEDRGAIDSMIDSCGAHFNLEKSSVANQPMMPASATIA